MRKKYPQVLYQPANSTCLTFFSFYFLCPYENISSRKFITGALSTISYQSKYQNYDPHFTDKETNFQRKTVDYGKF